MLGAMSFLNRDTDLSVSSSEKTEKICSFSQDASLIFSAFFSKYGIDLEKTDMHWYKFCALFESLADENPFKTVLKIRTADETQIKNPKARSKIAALKTKYRIKSSAEVNVADNIEDLF